jgi:hypothetical protein
LAFNYGILSLMTLTLGTDEMKVELQERPTGCLSGMSEDDRLQLVIDLLMRDFRTTPGSNVSTSICVILDFCVFSNVIR